MPPDYLSRWSKQMTSRCSGLPSVGRLRCRWTRLIRLWAGWKREPAKYRRPILLDTMAFGPSALGTEGDARRRFFHGPGINQWDFALLKDTKITERFDLQFRAEFFNIFNHTQFLTPSGITGFNCDPARRRLRAFGVRSAKSGTLPARRPAFFEAKFLKEADGEVRPKDASCGDRMQRISRSTSEVDEQICTGASRI